MSLDPTREYHIHDQIIRLVSQAGLTRSLPTLEDSIAEPVRARIAWPSGGDQERLEAQVRKLLEIGRADWLPHPPMIAWLATASRLAHGTAARDLLALHAELCGLYERPDLMLSHGAEVGVVPGDGPERPSAPDPGTATVAARQGPLSWVRALAWSPASDRLATGSDDGSVRIWQATDARERLRIDGGWGPISAVAWSPDGARVVAVGAADSTAWILDGQTGRAIARLPDAAKRASRARWCADGRVALLGEAGVCRWDPASGGVQRRAMAGGTAMACAPNGSALVAVSAPGDVIVWGPTGEVVWRAASGSRLTAAAWSPDGRVIATTGEDRLVRLWDARDGTPLRRLAGHTAQGLDLSWAPGSDRLASSAWDGTVRIWDATTGTARATITCDESWIDCVAWSPDGRSIAYAGRARHVRAHIWDVESKRSRATLAGAEGRVRAVAWSPDGASLAAAMGDGTARTWDIVAGVQTSSVPASGYDSCHAVAWSPTSDRLATAGADGTIRIRDRAGALAATYRYADRSAMAVAWGPEGRWLAAAGTAGHVEAWDVLTHDRTRLGVHDRPVFGLARRPSGDEVASCDLGGTLRITHGPSGTSEATPVGGGPRAIDWAPDGRRLATIAAGAVTVWGVQKRRCRVILRFDIPEASSLAWSPTGEVLATASNDGAVRLWSAEDGRALARLEGHTRAVSSVTWAPDGRRLASGGADGTVRIWSARAALATLYITPEGTCIITPSGAYLASGEAEAVVERRSADAPRAVTLEPPGDAEESGRHPARVRAALAGAEAIRPG